jgi:hypothetical protein
MPKISEETLLAFSGAVAGVAEAIVGLKLFKYFINYELKLIIKIGLKFD